MSKFLSALNQIEQEKSAQNVRSVSVAPPKESFFGWPWKFIFPLLITLTLLTGAYFFAKYQPLNMKAKKVSSEPTPLTSFFTIQLITYRTEPRAKEQVLKLATEGYETFVASKGGYFLVCLGRFPNQNLAERKWAKLKTALTGYQGVYIRFIHE